VKQVPLGCCSQEKFSAGGKTHFANPTVRIGQLAKLDSNNLACNRSNRLFGLLGIGWLGFCHRNKFLFIGKDYSKGLEDSATED
jgi:hypothetical protein